MEGGINIYYILLISTIADINNAIVDIDINNCITDINNTQVQGGVS